MRSELIGLGGIVERNVYLTKRYFLWDVAFMVWTIANTLTIVFIARSVHLTAAAENVLATMLLVGAVIWAFLGIIFEFVTETVAWERWEGTIEYTFMAPISRVMHLGGQGAFAVLYGLIRATILFFAVVLFIGIHIPHANYGAAFALLAIASLSFIGIGMMTSVLPLVSPEKGAQLGFVAQGLMLVVSGVYYPVSVMPNWMQCLVEAVAGDVRAPRRPGVDRQRHRARLGGRVAAADHRRPGDADRPRHLPPRRAAREEHGKLKRSGSGWFDTGCRRPYDESTGSYLAKRWPLRVTVDDAIGEMSTPRARRRHGRLPRRPRRRGAALELGDRHGPDRAAARRTRRPRARHRLLVRGDGRAASAKPGGDDVAVTIGDFATTRVDGHVLARLPRLQHDHEPDDAGRAGRVLRERRRPSRTRRLFRRRGRHHCAARASRSSTLSDTHVGIDEYDAGDAAPRLAPLLARGGALGSGLGVPFCAASPAELDLMARLAGMRLRERWSGWNREPFTAETTRHVSVWEKAR